MSSISYGDLSKKDIIEMIISRNPFFMRSTIFTRQVKTGGEDKWVWIRERLESMPYVNLTVVHRDLITKEESYASNKFLRETMGRHPFRKKIAAINTTSRELEHYKEMYLGIPLELPEPPNCNRINCPVLTKKDFKNRDGSVEAIPYCGMYSRYLTKKAEVITPCGPCLRERRSLWES